MNGATLLPLLALAAPVDGSLEETEDRSVRRPLEALGFDALALENHQGRRLDIGWVTRADRILLRGQLQLGFDPAHVPDEVTGLEVRLNDAVLRRLERTALLDGDTAQLVELDERLLSGRDVLTLILTTDELCARLPSGTWRMLRDAALETVESTLPLPADLSLLPLPFVDGEHEAHPELQLVLPRFDAKLLEAAALAVGGFSRRSGGRVRPKVGDALPSGHAVVLVDRIEDAKRFGVPFHETPTAELVPSPRGLGMVLVLSASTPRGVGDVAAQLFTGELPTGPLAIFSSERPAGAKSPSRWVDTRRPLSLARIADGPLVHHGTSPGTLSATFRISPELTGWPYPTFELEAHHRRKASPDSPPAKIDVTLNHRHIGTLPASRADDAPIVSRLRVPRGLIRGFNELKFHVRYETEDCATPIADSLAEVEISTGTRIHLDHFWARRPPPDVELFAFDGFPFTRHGDLRGTVAVLPPEPIAEEVSVFLGAIAHLSSITGDLPLGLTVLTAAALPATSSDKDVLLVGRASRHPLLQAWSHLSPAGFRGGRTTPKRSEQLSWWQVALSAELDWGELERAEKHARAWTGVGTLAAFASPLAPRRSVVSISADRPEDLYPIDAFRGYAEAQRPGGDLILIGEEDGTLRRSRHHLRGPDLTFDLRGPLDVLWLISRLWVVLIPAAALSVLLLLRVSDASLRRRAVARLSVARDWGAS